MQPTQLVRAVLLILTSAGLLGGCATTKEDLLPQDGPTMLEVYEGHLSRAGKGAPKRTGIKETVCRDEEDCESTPVEPSDAIRVKHEVAARTADRQYYELVGYTREVNNEIQQLFPTLPNPTLVMYVFPHLAGTEQLPVPGYATSFSMYSRTEYALPGEVSQQQIDAIRQRRNIQPVVNDEPQLRAVSLPIVQQ